MTTASARGRPSRVHGCVATAASGEWTLKSYRKRALGDFQRGGHALAVLAHMRGVVVGAEAAIEARIDAFRNAALAGEEGVAHALERGECRRFNDMLELAAASGDVKPGRRRQFPVRESERLEQLAHAGRGIDKACKRRFDRLRLSRRALFQAFGAQADTETAEKVALRHRPVQAHAFFLHGLAERLEVDVRGEIGFAGVRERIGGLVPAYGLQRVAERRRMWP